MVRTPWFDKSGRKKGSWTAEEDKKLIAYVTRYGCWNWRQLPRFAGLARCGKSCRLRWLNYLRPDVKRGDYSQEEEEVIVNLHQKLGSRWSVIAANLPGRTDNDIKNHWNSTLKKRFFFPTPKTLQQQQQDFQFVNNNTNQEEEDDDIWSESFLAELMQDNNNNNNNEYYCSVGYYGLESTLLLQPAVENSWIHQFVADDISHVPNHLFPHQFSQ